MLSLLVPLTACKETHNYANKWSVDENAHWQPCTDDGCNKFVRKGAHTPDSAGICTVCGYTSNSAVAVSAVVTYVANSAPTKIVGNTSQYIGERELVGNYELVIDTYQGNVAAVYKESYQRFREVEEGATTVIVGAIEEISKTVEYVAGMGVRENGGAWVPGATFPVPEKGDISLNLNVTVMKSISYDNHTLRFSVAKENTEAVLGTEFSGDVNVTVVDDGEVITAVTITYTLPAATDSETGNETAAVDCVIEIVYSYDNEEITIS